MSVAPPRSYIALHSLDAAAELAAKVIWNGTKWNVSLNDELLPDCCDTIVEAYAAAEAEIRRRFPLHDCALGCRAWQHFGEA